MASSGVRVPVTMRLPCAASSVAVARSHLRSWLREQGAPPEVVEDARLVVSELVANSVRHARPLADGQVQVSFGVESGGILVSVTDGGSTTRPRALEAPASALAGRGMAIVDRLSQEWWTERTGSRSTVHALLPL